jgi:O-antigen/teichoic acid export membrane protein
MIVANTIYPAICAVQSRLATLEELFLKSNRLAMMWALPFCAGFVLFAPDLVAFVLGDEWLPAVVLLQGLGAAALIQQIGWNWFSFYRAAGDPRPQSVESVVLVAGFAALALPGLALWGAAGFVWGRIATALATLVVRRFYVRRLLPGVELLALALRGVAPVAAAAAAVGVLRLALWGGERPAWQALAEVLLFAAVTALVTWWLERPLLREALGALRSGRGGVPLVA